MAGSLSDKFLEVDKRMNGWKILFTALREQSDKNCPLYEDAKLAANARLNRYRDVLPFDHSRVRLGKDGYINASHVPIPEADRSYILTQGPLSNTSGDFWQMVWEQKSCAVVMLNRVMEKGQCKCHLYYPTADENNGYSSKTQKYDNFEVELLNERKTKHYVVRSIQLANTETGESREITHFQFITWPDFGVPDSTSDFLEFLLEVRRSGLLNYRKHGPPVIHCSAGIGRSGTFVIADAALVIAHKTKDPSQVDIVQMVLDLRQFRMGLIQTHEQLRFSWKAVVDALEQKRWKELVETTCSDDLEHESDPETRPFAEEGSKPTRPVLKRASGNQFTDDSSDTETEDVYDDDESAAAAPAASAAVSKELEKSPKRPRPDVSRSNPSVDQVPSQTHRATDADEQKEETNKNDETKKPATETQGGATEEVSRATSGSNTESAPDTATERYEARLRRRQQRALEAQKKIDKIHENLRRASSADVWSRYANLFYGGAAVLVGGLLVYLFCRWGF